MVMSAKECYKKWIEKAESVVDLFQTTGAPTPRWFDGSSHTADLWERNFYEHVNTMGLDEAWNLLQSGKITYKRRKKGQQSKDGDEIQRVLANCTEKEQYERDVAMWYAHCIQAHEGAQVARRLFTILSEGVFYRKNDNTWRDFGTDFPDVPIASLLSHGLRFIIQLPASKSRMAVTKAKAGKFFKALIVDPLKAPFDPHAYRTLRTGGGKSTAAAWTGNVLGGGFVQATKVGHKVADAGDNTIWNWFSAGVLHKRAMASHNMRRRDNPLRLPANHWLYFDEEKAGMGRNVRAAYYGRHHYKNMSLGGQGNMNPFSGITVDKDGAHGHLYVNYRPPQVGVPGCMLLGVEGSAPGVTNQTGKAHTSAATKGAFTATGGEKWNKLKPNLYKPPDTNKSDVAVFAVDLTYLGSMDLCIARLTNKVFNPEQLHYPVPPARIAPPPPGFRVAPPVPPPKVGRPIRT
jgi:hypothetical protein